MLNRYAKVLISKRHIYDLDKTKFIFSPENIRVRRSIAENRIAPRNKSSVEARSPASYFHYFAARVKRTLFLSEPCRTVRKQLCTVQHGPVLAFGNRHRRYSQKSRGVSLEKKNSRYYLQPAQK